MTAIEAENLYRLYADEGAGSVALQGLTLSVEEGELLVVLGPSGSGKSTLLRILAGLDRPSAGTVRAFDHDLRTLRGRGLREYRTRTLGYADQHYTRALLPELGARDQVALRLGLIGLERRERDRRADELLERVGLLDRADARPGELSGGQQQRIALCAALAHRPKLLIADEPTGELDRENAAQIYAAIRELTSAAGATTIVVSHDPESASVADRVVQIRDGRVSEESRDGEARGIVNRGGWIRVPEELLRRAGLERRARIELDERGVLVSGDAARDDRELERAAASSPGETVAEVRGLGYAYDGAPVLTGLDAAFAGAVTTAVTGPSGSGKTTLLHLLAGLVRPQAGEVVVAGTALGSLDDAARAALRRSTVALVQQGTDLVPFLDARETVEIALLRRGASRAGARHDAETALAAVGLAELAGQRVGRLSMGERQRVAIARALAAKPKLLLADEPTARLDEENARAIGALFAALAAETGAAVVCATHDPVLIAQAHVTVALDSGT